RRQRPPGTGRQRPQRHARQPGRGRHDRPGPRRPALVRRRRPRRLRGARRVPSGRGARADDRQRLRCDRRRDPGRLRRAADASLRGDRRVAQGEAHAADRRAHRPRRGLPTPRRRPARPAPVVTVALDRFERFPLVLGPSPVHRLDRLTEHLGGAGIWAKRDDVSSGLAFGGNKTRKLEYLVADGLAQGCDTWVSIGGVQSNHPRRVAAAAARAGLGCVLVQESWVDWPDVVYDRAGNIRLSRILGAEVRLVESTFGIGCKESWEQALADVEARGGKPYAIPAGAS